MNNITTFNNPAFGSVRAVSVNDEPYFVGKDVAEILGYSNPRDALSKHVDAEDRGVANCDTLGGTQELTVINESGLYNLIFQSRKPEAKAFRKWVTSEVLPSIRRTGRYALAGHGCADPRKGDWLDLRCEPYDTKWLGTTTVRVIEYEDVEWYSVGDILRAMQTGTETSQTVARLREANPAIVRKIFVFGNTHPAWFTTITGLRLLVSGSRKLKTHSRMLQLEEGGVR